MRRVAAAFAIAAIIVLATLAAMPIADAQSEPAPGTVAALQEQLQRQEPGVFRPTRLAVDRETQRIATTPGAKRTVIIMTRAEVRTLHDALTVVLQGGDAMVVPLVGDAIIAITEDEKEQKK